MKVLYISAWFPFPQDNGARIRAYNLMKGLASAHEVHLISLLQEDSDPASAQHLTDVCRVMSLHESRWFKPGTLRSLGGFLSTVPRSVVDTYDRAVEDAIRQAVRSIAPDVIVASSLGVAAYVPHNVGVPTVLDEHNCEYGVLRRAAGAAPGGLRRLRNELTWRKAARWEANTCEKFSAVAIVSESDRSQLLDAAPKLDSVHIVPNGVDTDYYSVDNCCPERSALIYNGALTYGANLDAVRFYAQDIYPLLSKLVPDAILRVTGRTSGVDVTCIAQCPGIALTGYVSDIRSVLKRSALCVVPLRQGGGSRLKILEAMASGVPVVSTRIGAEGLDLQHEKHAIIADSPAEFADAVARVLGDPALRASLVAHGRQLVEDHYSWSVIAPRFRRIVETVASNAN